MKGQKWKQKMEKLYEAVKSREGLTNNYNTLEFSVIGKRGGVRTAGRCKFMHAPRTKYWLLHIQSNLQSER
jgi:hypothetical protein